MTDLKPPARWRLPALLFLALILTGQGKLWALSDFYWEQPEVFSPGAGHFPVAAYGPNLAVIAWQESEPVRADSGEGRIWISLAVKTPRAPWRVRSSVGGPYAYAGTEPSILSITLDDRGRIIIAVAASTTQTEILISEDQGERFLTFRLNSGAEGVVAPRIFTRADGGYLLFVTVGQERSLSIYYARSDDAIHWSAFEPFIAPVHSLSLSFLPTHAAREGVDYVAFQSFVGEADAIPSFQIFTQSSADGGRTWSSPRLITGFRDSRRNTAAAPSRFDNQRPHISIQNGRVFMVWERRYGTASPQIYGAFLGDNGAIQGIAEQINTDDAYCNNPIALSYRNEITVTWFDNRRGTNRVFLAQRAADGWRNYDLSGAGGEALFARPVVSGTDLLLFWQRAFRNGARIYALAPDTTVAAPQLSALNFRPGGRSRGDRVRIAWNTPYDSSGIMGFSYLWSRDPGAAPDTRLRLYPGSNSVEEIADEDGSWYFSVRAQDFAGNWSPVSRIEYIRDTTPPPAAVLIPPELDEEGYLPANSFSLSWNPPPASDIAGYTWNLEYLGSAAPFSALDGQAFTVAADERFSAQFRLPAEVLSAETSASFDNQDNGVWRFSVSAVDEVGNIGPPSSVLFRTNKYIPHTYISYVDAVQDEQGILTVRIFGRGFADGGLISRVFFDRDGQAPYDREYYLDRGDYQVLSDREIVGLKIEDIEQGLYLVGVEHPLRGRHVTAPLVAVDETGTVKFGDYSQTWRPSWTIREGRRLRLDTVFLIVIGIILFSALGLAVSIRKIGAALAERAVIRSEAMALIMGDIMPREKRKQIVGIRRRGTGLRLKFASFTIVLVILVVAMVSAPLYLMMTRTHEETLLRGLWDRSFVLMEGLASSARAYLPSGNRALLELGFLPNQSAVLPEARYVTITGYDGGGGAFGDVVWATNDPDILNKIDTAEFRAGVSRLEDVLSPRIEEEAKELNGLARLSVSGLSTSITSLTQEAIALALLTDERSVQRLNDIQVTIRSLEIRLAERLKAISQEIGSEPAFDLDRLSGDTERYIFFKPVMYRQGSEDVYFRGIIRLEISIESIMEQLINDRRALLRVILLVALTALTIGALGALVLATLIIGPIRKLVSYVELIRDTEDKSKLAGADIIIRSRDELAVLGSTINEMTHSLVKAAQAASDLTIGKEVQKKFIPLDLDREGNKLTSGFKDTRYAEFFGYYEGAKGVSGDYFDYQDLDGRYYAIIKCDVAGKGIPAALIMIQVATMFLNYFKTWKPTAKGMHIEEVVYHINDFIEALGFKGRFAAFTLALLDTQTGVVRFCNAGDNIVHWFDASEGRMKLLTLPETPATGVLPNFLVESKGGYAVQTMNLDHGDILFLYTDGIEEAKRKFRNSEFREIVCAEGIEGSPHDQHVAGQGDEEMGPHRVEAIINAVLNRQPYSLHKFHNPEGEVALRFDFSHCQGRVEDAIMAMVGVEKMFRLYKAPGMTEDSRVLVDKKVDGFLKEHFLQYRVYCQDTREYSENAMYMYYTHVMEDPQYDDLTIIGIKRK